VAANKAIGACEQDVPNHFCCILVGFMIRMRRYKSQSKLISLLLKQMSLNLAE
jgi:hypothetical protein